MPGPAPQPGETRGPDGNPWASGDAGGEWWHGDTAAHPIVDLPDASTSDDPDGGTPAADPGGARLAGESDLAQAAAAGRITIPGIMGADPAAPAKAERTGDDSTEAAPAPPAGPDGPTLPEPRDRERPVPVLSTGHPDERGVRRVTRPVQGPPGRDRAAQHQSTLVAKLESSPFWLGGDEQAPTRATGGAAPGRLGVPPRRVPPAPRRPALGLPALLLLAMAATFFAWVSAEPLWLAVGHGERGTAVVTACTGDGVGQRCRGDFTADGGHPAAAGVALLGVAADRRGSGSVVPARMVPDSRRAYAATNDLTWHLRWAIGVLMVLLSGLGIAAATGARRLETPRARRTAVLISLGGPLALLAGFLAMTY